MGNQFDARLVWHRREIFTCDEATGAVASIHFKPDGTEKPYLWALSVPGQQGEIGRTKTEQAARDAVRRRIVKLPVKGGA